MFTDLEYKYEFIPSTGPLRRLKGLRAERLLTQADIAKSLGISKATYNRKENGVCQFGILEINKLLYLFQVPYEELFR